jgi:hypothetical protein
VELFSGELLRGQVFLPAKQPLALGSQLALTFELPDRSEIALHARVEQVVQAGRDGHNRTGLWLSHAGLSTRDAAFVQERLRALATEAAPAAAAAAAATAASAPAQEPEIEVGVLTPRLAARKKAPERPLREQLRELQEMAFSLEQKDDLSVLGLDPTATDDDVRRAYLALAKRYHPHRYARLGSAEAEKLATEIYVRAQAAFGALTGSQRVPQPEGGARPRTPRTREGLEVSEAVGLLDYHQYDAALERLAAVLKAEPEHEAARLWSAVALARKKKAAGDLAGMSASFRRVLELDPEHAEATAELAAAGAQRPRGLLARLFGKGS